jgi:hypothetical protein
VLGAYSRPDLEIILNFCTFTIAGTSALVEVLGRNQGPTKLARCYVDYSILADGLRGNSRLKSLRPRISTDFEVGNREIHAIADALQDNKGIVELNLSNGHMVSDGTWGVICDSLATHPTLEVLDLLTSYNDTATAPSAVCKSRVQALVDMLKVNISHNTLALPLSRS